MKKILVIGGGFFGMYLSENLAKKGHQVILVEKEDTFMQRASYVNQARVHNGYHYPRSVLTALRSRLSLPKFYDEFRTCIDDSFDKYYMISRLQSKISAKQFEKFCYRIGAECEPAPHHVTSLIDKNYVEAVFKTKEFAFNSYELKNLMITRLEEAGVISRLKQTVSRVFELKDRLSVEVVSTDNNEEIECIEVDHVFNCTYSMINQVLTCSKLEIIPLKHELTEMVIVEVPDILKNTGITVMDGPFFSVMPFPSKNAHSFTHVRYTPHYEWLDTCQADYINGHKHFAGVNKQSSYKAILQDSQRYIPILSECRYLESIWEVKTILPRSETNDSRPILFKPNHGLKGLHTIMGGKIDNVYDVVDVIESTGLV